MKYHSLLRRAGRSGKRELASRERPAAVDSGLLACSISAGRNANPTQFRTGPNMGRDYKSHPQHRLPERCEFALVDAAFGYRVRNGRYREENNISEVVASRDLRKLCDLGLLNPIGEKRGRYYWLQIRCEQSGISAGRSGTLPIHTSCSRQPISYRYPAYRLTTAPSG